MSGVIAAAGLEPRASVGAGHPALDISAAYRAHYAFLWRMVRHMGVPAAAADDVVQDVFVVVSRRHAEYVPRAPLRAWLLGIARRVARDHRKLSGRLARRRHALRVVMETRQNDGQIARAEAAQVVGRLLAALPESKRLVLVLADLEGWTAPEIAQALNLKLNTIYSRLFAARRALEREVSRHGPIAQEASR